MINKFSIIFSTVLILALGALMLYTDALKDQLNHEKEYNLQLNLADSIENAKTLRKLEEKFHVYKDSLANEQINTIIKNNEKAKKKVINLRKSIPTASDSIKDSIWAASFQNAIEGK